MHGYNDVNGGGGMNTSNDTCLSSMGHNSGIATGPCTPMSYLGKLIFLFVKIKQNSPWKHTLLLFIEFCFSQQKKI